MLMTNHILETELLHRLTGRFGRSPLQLNRQREADAELLRFPSGCRLAVTIDTVAEEIMAGLYDDPYLAGWMVVTASVSDLAAVGADPLGILVSEVLPGNGEGVLDRLQAGIDDACRQYGTHVLGGDTNTGTELLLTGCAIGAVEHPLSRVGCRPGENLFATGPLGIGNAFALARHLGWPGVAYQPVARLREGRMLVGKASSCMDTSDGVLATLDELMRLNNCGFEIDSASACLDPAARTIGERAGAPWLMLAGEHGEFELLFTLAPGRELEADGWRPMHIGRVIAEQEIRLGIDGRMHLIDTGRTRNMRAESHGDLKRYVKAMFDYDEEFRKGRS
jgi:thiamine-monophosphate kinase